MKVVQKSCGVSYYTVNAWNVFRRKVETRCGASYGRFGWVKSKYFDDRHILASFRNLGLTNNAGSQQLLLHHWGFPTSVVIEGHEDILGTGQWQNGLAGRSLEDPDSPRPHKPYPVGVRHLHIHVLPGRLAHHHTQLGQVQGSYGRNIIAGQSDGCKEHRARAQISLCFIVPVHLICSHSRFLLIQSVTRSCMYSVSHSINDPVSRSLSR